MSIDLNWETLTTGPDGDALAHSIRDFIHTKFQSVSLPRFIKSVTVHDFAFGATPPELELKDITDPLPDFYEENPAADDDEDSDDEDDYVVERDGDGDGDGEYGEYERGGGRGRGGNGRFGGLAVPGGRFAANGSGGGGVHGLRGAGSATTDLRRRGNGGAPSSSNSKGAKERPGAPPHLRTGAGGARLSAIPPHITTTFPGAHMRGISSIPQDMGSPFLGTSTPGIPGGTSNLHYFHSHLAGGLSGTQTPLAAVAGAQLGNNNPNNNNNQYDYRQSRTPEAGGSSPMSVSTAGFPEHLFHGAAAGAGIDHRAPSHSRNPSQGSISVEGFNQPTASSSLSGLTPIHLSDPALREKSSVSTFAATSSGGTSRPPTRDKNILAGSAIVEDDDIDDDQNISDEDDDDNEKHPRFREPRIEDIQAVFRIRYSGDVKLLLTADILLDYPMPSFVGIPLRLSITGLSFDGVGVVAYIRKRVHFCFLSPEDALAAVGADDDEGVQQEDGSGSGASGGNGPAARNTKMGGLLQEIRVESEIGQREGGKQSLKNVGKVERFVLEQVRRIFEEEFVYPSFWTFLV